MGIYSTNCTILSENDFIADESYANAFGAYRMMVESKQNDLALFNNVIQIDFQEAYANANGDETTLMESVMALQEAGASNLWQSFIELIKKIGAKIKAIFEKFIAKLNGMFTKDTKALLKKYESKFSSADLSTMAVKNYKPLKNITDPMKFDVFTDTNINSKISTVQGNGSSESISKAIPKETWFLSQCLKKAPPEFRDTSAFRDYLDKEMFGLPTDAEGAVKTDKQEIMSLLRDNKIITNTEKHKTQILKDLKGLQRTAEEEKKNTEKNDKLEGKDKELALAKANAAITSLNNANSAVTTAFTAWTSNLKTAIAQSKKVFVMGATFTPKGEATLLEAQCEVLEEEVLAYFNED